MMHEMRAIEALSAAEIEVVATHWQRDRRVFTTSFEGTSMLPAIAPGHPVTFECGVDPAIGDVVVFRFQSRIGVHRVAGRGADWVLTWGDANALPDQPIAPGCVIGRVRNVSAVQPSFRRAALLRLVVPTDISIAQLTGRIKTLYRVRGWIRQGAMRMVRKAARKVFHPRTASG